MIVDPRLLFGLAFPPLVVVPGPAEPAVTDL
jgi:hypothetical protein